LNIFFSLIDKYNLELCPVTPSPGVYRTRPVVAQRVAAATTKAMNGARGLGLERTGGVIQVRAVLIAWVFSSGDPTEQSELSILPPPSPACMTCMTALVRQISGKRR
jgi:hypothetical protein